MGEQPPEQVEPLLADVEQIVGPIARHFASLPVSPEAVLWPNAEDLPHRFHALLNGVDWSRYSSEEPLRLLDLGCGPGFLLNYLGHAGLIDRVDYTGVDLNPDVLAAARERWPERRFLERDVRSEPFPDGLFDYAVLCGVFTVRFSLNEADMRTLLIETLQAIWPSTVDGLAYNVMSKHVDWERDDLFHLPCDDALTIARDFLGTRQVRILHDYGLFEYSCVVSREPTRNSLVLTADWFDRRC